jgi:hypothetical protein
LTEPFAATIKRAVKGDIDQGDELDRARLRGRRAGLGLVIVAASAFIAVSTAQITSAVFGLGTEPLASGPGDSPERRCAVGISQLVRALERPVQADPPTARAASAADWKDADSVEQTCRTATGGLDAWAALLRLKAAELQLTHAGPADLQPLRGEVAAHLPPDLR